MKPFLKVPTRYWSISGTGYFVVNHGVLELCDDPLQNFRLYANYAGRFAVLVLQATGVVHGRLGHKGLACTAWIFFIATAVQTGIAPLCFGAGGLSHRAALDLFVRSGKYGEYAVYNNIYFQWVDPIPVCIFYTLLPAIYSNGCFTLGGAGQSGSIGLLDIAHYALARRGSTSCGC